MSMVGYRILNRIVGLSGNTMGYTVIHIPTRETKTMTIEETIGFVEDHGCENAAVSMGKLVWLEIVHGDYGRLPQFSSEENRIVKDPRVVVLEARYNGGKEHSMVLMDCYGGVKEFGWGEAIEIIARREAVNAKLVPVKEGKRLSAMNGSISKIDINKPKRYFTDDSEYYDIENGVLLAYYPKGKSGKLQDRGAVIIPKSVKEIGEEAFALKEIMHLVMHEDITKIGDRAFASCGINELTLPERLEFIGEKAFYDNNIKRVELNGSLKYIGDWAFASNKGIKVTLNRANRAFKKIFNCIYTWDGTELVIGSKNSDLYGKVEVIRRGAFEGIGVKIVRLPPYVRYIGERAFANNKIDLVGLPQSLSRIGDGAFQGNKITHLRVDGKPKIIGKGVFDANKIGILMVTSEECGSVIGELLPHSIHYEGVGYYQVDKGVFKKSSEELAESDWRLRFW